MTTPAQPIDAAVALLRGGGLVAFPTETVYGLGADAGNAEAVARIFTVKGRPAEHPLIVHLAGAEQVDDWALDIPPLARQLASVFWPGPLTLILRRGPKALDCVTGCLPSVGLRVPAHPLALELLRSFGGGIAAPSANRYGRVSPTSAEHVRADLGESVDCILDGGPCSVGVESTIVDLSGLEADGTHSAGRGPAILRYGAVTPEDLRAATGLDFAHGAGGGVAVRAPGMHASHYAPACRVLLCSDAAELTRQAHEWSLGGSRVGVLDFGLLGAEALAALPAFTLILGLAPSLGEVAAHLYQRLRDADAAGCEVLLTLLPEQQGLGLAIADRLRRAAGLGAATENEAT